MKPSDNLSEQMDMQNTPQTESEDVGSLDSAIAKVKSFIQRPALATTQALDELLMDLEDMKGDEKHEPMGMESDLSSALDKGE